MEWVGPADQGYVAVASNTKVLISFATFAEPVTVIRVRGQVSVFGAATGDLNIIGAFGMGIVSDEAFAAGVGSIPGPFSNADWGGWFVWRSFSYRIDFQDATGVNWPNWSFEVDSKAMRKLKSNETLVLVSESQQGAYSISTPLRTLTKLA